MKPGNSLSFYSSKVGKLREGQDPPLRVKVPDKLKFERGELRMNILVTGAGGFVGKNLCCTLKTIRDGAHPLRLPIREIFECDRATPPEKLADFCARADFVFHLAGVNRPADPAEFIAGNVDFTDHLLRKLRESGNCCPVMYASSVQAENDTPYGRSKRAGEGLLLQHSRQSGAKVLLYRFPNLFGKWSRPDYNSVVATFCHNIARDIPIEVRDPAKELELAYIDDVVHELLRTLRGGECRKGDFCVVPTTHRVSLGYLAGLLRQFRAQPDSRAVLPMPNGSFEKKLYSTYISFLPPERAAIPLDMRADDRGSFTELLKTPACGQFSVSITAPGAVRGQHWHHSKWEFFMVVSGRGLVRMRKLGTEEVREFPVSGEKIEALHILPGYTHELINISETENLVTLLWANEVFDPENPDTYRERV